MYGPLVKSIDVFKNNGNPENFNNNLSKTFLDNKHRIQEKLITVSKKPFFSLLFFLSLGVISLQTRTKLRKFLKGIGAAYRLCL